MTVPSPQPGRARAGFGSLAAAGLLGGLIGSGRAVRMPMITAATAEMRPTVTS
ncbi:hypothetical protein MBRA_00056 [Methylobacterium brachiatum]|nr:hypothetical protein MBRA_00056 [Methylobacterium brachiatum]